MSEAPKDPALAEAQQLLLTIYEQMGEGFHTAFRKGVDGKGSHEVWVAIRNMTNDGYGDALAWFSDTVGLLDYLEKHELVEKR